MCVCKTYLHEEYKKENLVKLKIYSKKYCKQ